jgi:hypothetical protein
MHMTRPARPIKLVLDDVRLDALGVLHAREVLLQLQFHRLLRLAGSLEPPQVALDHRDTSTRPQVHDRARPYHPDDKSGLDQI